MQKGAENSCMAIGKCLLVILFLQLPGTYASAQGGMSNVKIQQLMQMSKRSINIGDSVLILFPNCKNAGVLLFDDRWELTKKISSFSYAASEPFFKIHGNILYNYTYRSYIDTPFAEHDVMQHLVQTNLNILVKNKYPVRVTITNRSSNSSLFQNATDVNVQFNRSYLLENIKGNLKEKAAGMVKTAAVNEFENLYKVKLQQLQAGRAWLSSPARIQEMVEAKEAQLQSQFAQQVQLPAAPLPSVTELKSLDVLSISKENKFKQRVIEKVNEEALAEKLKNQRIIDTNAIKKYEEKKQETAKLEKEVKELYGKAAKVKKAALDSVNKIKAEINYLKTGAGLYSFMRKHHISKDSLSRMQRLLLSVNQVGIGRAWVDYSELTVKNISLAGFNIEMNPLPYYFAFAAGKVNYRFRDFIVKNSRELPSQSLYLVRAGFGEKEKNSLIFTFYNGKKNVLNSTPGLSPSVQQNVLGYSAEARLALNENNYVVAEIAKSSWQHAGAVLSNSQLMDKALDWKTRANEAYSVKLFSQYPATYTKLTAWYRKMGEHFQSFNLYPLNTNLEAFSVRLNQQFWKRRVVFDASIRKNDFESPIAAPSFSTTALFKSLQLTVRVPKYPFVTVGYYPSSQLSLANGNVLTENQYNTLNALVSHSYRFAKINMNTNGVYTKFYNSSGDTGFIYYNAASYTVNHSLFITPFLLQSSFAVIDQKELKMKTLEQLVGYQFKNKLTVSGSLKWNRVNNAESLFGGTASVSMYLKKIGTIQLNYDKTYLPGSNRLLMPVDIGRASFYREF